MNPRFIFKIIQPRQWWRLQIGNRDAQIRLKKQAKANVTNVYNYAELEIVPCTVYDLTVTPALEVRFTFFRKTYTKKMVGQDNSLPHVCGQLLSIQHGSHLSDLGIESNLWTVKILEMNKHREMFSGSEFSSSFFPVPPICNFKKKSFRKRPFFLLKTIRKPARSQVILFERYLLPSSELKYPTLGKGELSSKEPWDGICWFPEGFFLGSKLA